VTTPTSKRPPDDRAAVASAPGDLPAGTAAALRLEVGRLRAAHKSECFGTTVHLGAPGSRTVTFAARPADRLPGDLATRVDVLLRLVAGTTGSRVPVWLTRPGQPSAEDEDHGWHAAARTATEALAKTLSGFWVVTRFGWLDLPAGRSRTWVRLRLSPPRR
jgi:hypothetical protein